MSRRPTHLRLHAAGPVALAFVLAITATAVVSAQSPPPGASPSVSPAPSPAPGEDAELAARFPAELGGVPLTVTTIRGKALLALGDADDAGFTAARDALTAALGAFGLGVEDVSAGWAVDSSTGTTVGLAVVRVAALDTALLASLAGAFIAIRDPGSTQEPIEIADRSLIRVTNADGVAVWHLYPRDDAVWILGVGSDALESVVGALP